MSAMRVGTRTPAYGRRAALFFGFGAVVTGLVRQSDAQGVYVPAEVQAGLLAKVASYDRNFAARAIDRAKLLLVAKADDGASIREVLAMKTALASIATVGGLPHDEELTSFTDAPTIARTCNSHRVAIVYFGPGLAAEIPAIRSALTSVDVLSVAAVPDYVPQGVVLGFDLVSGSPKLLLHLGQARAQNIHFGARILKRMTIYE